MKAILGIIILSIGLGVGFAFGLVANWKDPIEVVEVPVHTVTEAQCPPYVPHTPMNEEELRTLLTIMETTTTTIRPTTTTAVRPPTTTVTTVPVVTLTTQPPSTLPHSSSTSTTVTVTSATTTTTATAASTTTVPPSTMVSN